MAEKKTMIATRVPSEFAEAVNFFAARERLSVANYTRSALSRRAANVIKDRYQDYKTAKKTAVLMRDALDNGTWRKLAAEDPGLFPASESAWTALLEQNEKNAEKALAEVKEMDVNLQAMGVGMLYG